MKRIDGFTLIELLVTMMIAVILATVAVPSFTTFIKNNRIVSNANNFVTALNLARSESVKRGANITLASAAGDTNWHDGWTVKQSTTLLRKYEALKGNMTLTGSAATIVFDSRGELIGSAQDYKLCDDRTGDVGINVSISVTGRPESQTATCP